MTAGSRTAASGGSHDGGRSPKLCPRRLISRDRILRLGPDSCRSTVIGSWLLNPVAAVTQSSQSCRQTSSITALTYRIICSTSLSITTTRFIRTRRRFQELRYGATSQKTDTTYCVGSTSLSRRCWFDGPISPSRKSFSDARRPTNGRYVLFGFGEKTSRREARRRQTLCACSYLNVCENLIHLLAFAVQNRCALRYRNST